MLHKVIDHTNLGYLWSKIKAAFWPKADTVSIGLDAAPTSGSDNLVKSGGVYTALSGKADKSTTPATYIVADSSAIPGGTLDTLKDGDIVTDNGYDSVVCYRTSNEIQIASISENLIYTYKKTGGVWSLDGYAVLVPDVSGKENISNKVTSLSSSSTNTQYPAAKTVYDEVHPTTGSSLPAGGLVPNKLYKLGTLTGSVTIAFATPADANVENEYKFTFTAGSTAPTISWPASVTKWCGNALTSDTKLPNVEASSYYEVSVVDGLGVFNKFE